MRREYSFSKVRRPLPGSTGLKYCTDSSEWRFMYQFPWGPDTVQSSSKKSRFLMFLYRKGNQSFGMCKQKEEKISRNLISSNTAFIILNSSDSRYISQSASKKDIFSFI